MNNKLPNDWHVLELKELIDKKRSIRYGIVQPGEYDANGRFMVRGQDYSFGWVEPEKLFKVSDVIESKYKNARLKTGDIILTIVGAGTGTVAVVPEWLDGANCTQTTARIAIESSKADSLFCYYYLSSDKGKKLTYQNIKGGAQPGLNCGDIGYFEIILPPLPEQKAIAQVLSTADAAIHTIEKLIAQKELRKKWLMQQLLTGKKRLKGFEGEWKEMHLGDFIVESRIPSTDNDVNRRITVKLNLKGIEKRDVRGSEAEDATYFFVRKKGQFIYGKQNLHKGAFGIIPEELDGFESSQDIPAFDFQEGVNPNYFMFFMSQEGFYQSLEKISTGTGSKRIHPENLFTVKVKFPSYEEQTAIAEVLRTADKEIRLLKAKAEKLREQKKGLMQVLLTGRVRLKIDNK